MPPSAEHPLGTDGLGRDVLARLMHGGAHLIAVAAVSTAVAAAVGVALGFAVSAKGRFADVLSYLLCLLYTSNLCHLQAKKRVQGASGLERPI